MTETAKRDQMIKEREEDIQLTKRFKHLQEEKRHLTLMSVYNLETSSKVPSQVLELFRADYAKARSEKRILELHLKYSPYIYLLCATSTIINNLINLRNIIKESPNTKFNDFTLGYVDENDNRHLGVFESQGLSREDKRSVKELRIMNQRARLENDNASFKDQVKVVKERVKELKRIVDTKGYNVARNQKDDDVRAYYITFLLAYATGRRFSEIVKTMKVVQKRKTEYYVYTGLLKGSESYSVKVRPIGLTEKEIQAYLVELRKCLTKTADFTVEDINKKLSGKFNEKLRRLYPTFSDKGLTKPMTIKSIRTQVSRAGAVIYGISVSDYLGHVGAGTGESYS